MTIATGSFWKNRATGTVVVISGIKDPYYVYAEYPPENENYWPRHIPPLQRGDESEQLDRAMQEGIVRIQIEDKAIDAIVKEVS